LIFGIIYCILSCASSIIRGCQKSMKGDDDEGGSPILTLISCLVCLPTCVLFFLFLAWFLADVIIFGLNSRLDGNGCPLIMW
jgi:hypothetical protein